MNSDQLALFMQQQVSWQIYMEEFVRITIATIDALFGTYSILKLLLHSTQTPKDNQHTVQQTDSGRKEMKSIFLKCQEILFIDFFYAIYISIYFFVYLKKMFHNNIIKHY